MCTGLEPIFLGMGASAGTAAALATATGALGGGLLAGKVLSPKQPDTPASVAQPPEKPPAPAKQPDRQALDGANAAAGLPGGPLAGNASTFLTGPGGVPTGSLDLGRNTLLGQ